MGALVDRPFEVRLVAIVAFDALGDVDGHFSGSD